MTDTLSSLLSQAVQRFEAIETTNLPSVSPDLQQQIQTLLGHFEKLRHVVEARGVISKNEELEDIPTRSIPFLLIPYYQAELTLKVIHTADGTHAQRERAIAVALEMYRDLQTQCVQLKIVDARDVDSDAPMDRTKKVALHKKVKELQTMTDDLIKRRKLRATHVEDIDEDPDSEETLRALNISTVHMRCLQTASSSLYVQQELSMLRALSPEQRLAAVKDYRENLEKMKQPPPPGQGIPLTTIGVDRLQIKDTAFMNRNKPTMTLEEFAQLEMAQMRENQTRQDVREARDKARWESLTEEEQVDAKQYHDRDWADWKDDHPPIGKTTKGNYS